MKTPRAFDIFGNVILVKFDFKEKLANKKKFAEKLLKEHKSVRTILEKTGKFKGRLRKQETKYLAGEKTKEVLYKENNCVFRFNIDDTYFSPRLGSERKDLAKKIRKGEVLVMFAGVGPYSVVIAKNSGAKRVYSNEINRQANKYGKLNAELNKIKDKIVFLEGDIKKVGLRKKFDFIVMPRPQLKETFLKEAFRFSKKGTRIFYYDFCKEDEIKEVVEGVKSEAKKARKKIKILKIKKAGEIAPYRYRIRIDFRVF